MQRRDLLITYMYFSTTAQVSKELRLELGLVYGSSKTQVHKNLYVHLLD